MPEQGKIARWQDDRGFGFIAPEGDGKDVFVHVSALERSGIASLSEGNKVSFVMEDDPKGRGKNASEIELA